MKPTIPQQHSLPAVLHAGDLVDEKDAAATLCIEVRTLRNWRALGKGPRYVKVGQRTVRYLRSELAAFVCEVATEAKK